MGKKLIFYFRFLILVALINFYFDKSIRIEFFLKFFICLILLLQIDIIFQHFFGFDVLGYPKSGPRSGGFFGDELIAGGFLSKVSGLYFFSTIYFLKKNKISLNYLIFLFFIFITSVFLTGERMALVLSLFSFLLIFILLGEIRKIIVFSSSIFLIVSFVILINNEGLYNRHIKQNLIQLGIKNKYSSASFADSHYGAIFLSTYEMIKKKPIIGYGVKQFRDQCGSKEFSNFVSQSKKIRCSTHPHNFILEILVETGLIGLFTFLLFLYVPASRFLKNIETLKNNDYSLLNLGAFVSFIIIIWPLKTSGSFFNNYNSIIFWFIISFAFLNYKKISEQKNE